jgi:hypothetical protein
MLIGTYVDAAIEYEALAERCATDAGYQCVSGAHMLAIARFSMHPDVQADIECNPEAFDARVRNYCYAHAMRNVPDAD